MTLATLQAQKGKVDREALLGRLLWFTIPDSTLLDYQTTLNELGAAGLTKALPRPPKDFDTFRRVTGDAAKTKVPHGTQAGVVENWMVRPVASDDDEIVRRAVVEVKDAAGRKLAFEQVFDMIYVRPTASGTSGYFKYEWLKDPRDWHTFNATDWPYADQMIKETITRYNAEKGKLSAGVVRQWLTRTIRNMGGTPCSPSGAPYFLKEVYADQVETLEAFCAKHLPTTGQCHSVELLDSDKQRDMIHRAIDRETVGAIEDITQEINECRREGKLTSKRFIDIQKRVKAVEKKNAGFMKMLQRDQGAIKSRLGLLATLAEELEPMQAARTWTRRTPVQTEPEIPVEEARPLPASVTRFLVD